MHEIAYRDHLAPFWGTQKEKPLVGKTRQELDIFFAVDAALPHFRYQFRFRRADNLRYHDLTIREYRLHSLSELYKLNPLLKYFVYGWAGWNEMTVPRLYVCHMEPLIVWLQRNAGKYPTMVNKDHSSTFKAIPFNHLPENIIAFKVEEQDAQLAFPGGFFK